MKIPGAKTFMNNTEMEFIIVVGQIMMFSCPPPLRPAPPRCPGPDHRTCEYITLRGKKNFADVIKLRMSRQRDYLGFSQWAQHNYKGLYKGR